MTAKTKAIIPIHKVDTRSGDKFDDQKKLDEIRTPELVIALCGPLGTPLHDVAKSIQDLLLSKYDYADVSVIRLSDRIRSEKKLAADCGVVELINAGNELRVEKGKPVLARMAIREISLAREKLQPPPSETAANDDLANQSTHTGITQPTVSQRSCHIIDSIKNNDELRLLRSVYGEMLHVVGVYAPIELRIQRLSKRIGKSANVYDLIDRDSGEESEHGQRVEETFPQSDFFLRTDSDTDSQLLARIQRFLDLALGVRVITPTPHERAMYAAFSAARNSACLSRQVGAAITDGDGEVLASGWNDVPRAFGGLYETRDPSSNNEDDHRCWNKGGGHCSNDEEKLLIAKTVVDKLIKGGFIDSSKKNQATALIREDSQLKNLIEFSRAVHAEMHALLNASKAYGSRLERGRLYVTTYPCHSCARHIVASGIQDIYFLEPYRKSLAVKLHSDSITESESDTAKVRLVPFDGVAPSKYLSMFSTWEGGRKDKSGKMRKNDAKPVTARTLEAVTTLEAIAIKALESTP
jgi:deoxycytidylate deaminase